MKPLKLLFLNLLIVSFAFNGSYAQNESHAQEMLSDFSKSKTALETLEKGLVDAAQSRMNGFTVTEVQIDPKTGMITVMGKNEKGGIETLADVKSTSYYDNSYRDNGNDNAKASRGYFRSWWDWLIGTEPVAAPEHEGDPLPPNYGKKPDPGVIMGNE
ncbi:MAG: hypothetical protein R3E32_11045 [Chitinophagales bacterium]